MPRLSISDVARQMRLRPSAIRYYEKLGILPKAERKSGKRCYDASILYRLAVIQQAREAGFRLPEIKALFFGFQERTRADARWRRMADRKLAELHKLDRQIRSMRILLEKMKANCHCKTLEVCGKAILAKGDLSRVERPPLPVTPNARVGQVTIRS